jgi:predicted transcriptional regulator
MEASNADWLPVVDNAKKFVGVVDRSRVVASLILEVDTRLRNS